jgi:hypothetical protein
VEGQDVKHTLNNQSKSTKQAGIALAVVAFATFGTALSAPPTGEIAFAKADISIATRTSEAQEVAVGDLVCSFRETGLTPFALVSYECRADAAALLEGCFFKNKLVIDAGTELTVVLDVSNVEAGHEAELFLANNSGAINGEVITAAEAPHGGGGEAHLCPEPLEQGVIAARWCGMSLTDTTNNIVGTTETELFEVFARGVNVAVPSCDELLNPAAP